MKLNLDCIREIMLCIEDNTGLRQSCCFIDTSLNDAMEFVGDIKEPLDYQSKLLEQYDNDELIYHLHYCIEADLLTISDLSNPYMILIDDLTPKGHDFLAHIRPETTWQKAKKIAEPIGALTVNSITQIAANVVTAGIKGYFGLP